MKKFKMRYDPGKPAKPENFIVWDSIGLHDGQLVKELVDRLGAGFNDATIRVDCDYDSNSISSVSIEYSRPMTKKEISLGSTTTIKRYRM